MSLKQPCLKKQRQLTKEITSIYFALTIGCQLRCQSDLQFSQKKYLLSLNHLLNTSLRYRIVFLNKPSRFVIRMHPIGGSKGGAAPPTGSNSFVFAYDFAEKCPRWKSCPPNGSAPLPNRKSWICHCIHIAIEQTLCKTPWIRTQALLRSLVFCYTYSAIKTSVLETI